MFLCLVSANYYFCSRINKQDKENEKSIIFAVFQHHVFLP